MNKVGLLGLDKEMWFHIIIAIIGIVGGLYLCFLLVR